MQRKFYDVRKLARIASHAIAEGYGEQISLGVVKLVDPDCDEPHRYTMYSRGGLSYDGVRIRPLTIHGAGRCRKCPPCKKGKSKMWMARAIDEYHRWPVTVFGTFTLSPANHDLLDNRARVRLREKDGSDFDALSSEARLTERVREFGAEVTNWIKRIRSGRDGHTAVQVRYLLVAEVHDSEQTSEFMRGRPHYHILLHEVVAGSAIKGDPRAAMTQGSSRLMCDIAAGEWEQRMVREKDGVWRPHAFVRDEAFIRKNWTLGFTKFEWASSHKSAYYVCKYVAKTLIGTRVRCSNQYGRLPNLPGSISLRSGQSLVEGRET